MGVVLIQGLAVGLVLLASATRVEAKTDVTVGVIYGHKAGMALVYDVFHPAKRKRKGAGVIYRVSGGWFSRWQEPSTREAQFKLLLDKGITVFAVHHGSAPLFKVSEAADDVRAGVGHIRANAKMHRVDPDRWGVWGGSAGGHLSLMLGIHSEGRPAEIEGRARFLAPAYVEGNDADAGIAVIVAYYPPVDLRGFAGPNERFPALDCVKDKESSISPLMFVDKNDPLTLLIHGDKDDLVPLSHSERMAAAFEKAGVDHGLVVIKDGDHGFCNPEHRAQATAAMVDWFVKHL